MELTNPKLFLKANLNWLQGKIYTVFGVISETSHFVAFRKMVVNEINYAYRANHNKLRGAFQIEEGWKYVIGNALLVNFKNSIHHKILFTENSKLQN